jgi:hypothetical protein
MTNRRASASRSDRNYGIQFIFSYFAMGLKPL